MSFVLKPSTLPNGSVGVFALHAIAKDTYLALFSENFEEAFYTPEEIPKELEGFCLDQPDGRLLCPKRFNQLDIGNYLNHSTEANLRWEKNRGYFAARDIQQGEELFADYRQLDEPESTWKEYYQGN